MTSMPPLPPPKAAEVIAGAVQAFQFARHWEAWSPFVWAIAAGWIAAVSELPRTSVDALVSDVVPTAVVAMAALYGLQTAGHLMMLATDSPVLRTLRESGHYPRLVYYLWVSARSQQSFVFFGVVILVLKACRFDRPIYNGWAPAALAFAWFHSYLSGIRTLRLTVALLLKYRPR